HHPQENDPPLSTRLLLVHVVRALRPAFAFKVRRKLVVALVGGLLVPSIVGGTLLRNSATPSTGEGQHPRTLCLASNFPTTGGQAGVGKPVENAVRLAVMQHHDLGNGYTLKLIPYNDAPASGNGIDPPRGASNVTNMVQTPCVLGMVGPMNS